MIRLEEDRRTGRTTRHIDAMIQHLFAAGEVFVKDHAGKDDPNEANRVFRVVVRRLEMEHPRVQITLDRGKRYIKLGPR